MDDINTNMLLGAVAELERLMLRSVVDRAEIDRLRELADKRGEIAVNRRREIERLRLTDAEREAVEWAVSAAQNAQHPADDALRGLLDRHAISQYLAGRQSA